MDSVVQAWLSGLEDVVGAQFEKYYQALIVGNEQMNLTAITAKDQVYLKHFWDSVQIERVSEWSDFQGRRRVLDVGTGAGFPGLPLAILNPEDSFVLLDSLQKRLRFLDETCTSLGIENITLVHGRAETMAKDPAYRNGFDFVVSRAVARLDVLCELTMPFVQPGGYFISYKGPSVLEEVEDAKRAARRLGGEFVRMESFQLPEGQGDRHLVVFRQRSATPSTYPRKAGTPQKSPLR